MKLWDHQKKCIDKAKFQNSFALFLEMGTGKTAIAIKLFEEKCVQTKEILKTLIFCPPVVIENWKREFSKHLDMYPGPIGTLYGPGMKRCKDFVNGQRNGTRIFVTNYESLLMKDLYELFTQWRADMLIFDESHKCKDIKAKRTKLAAALSRGARFRYILTGTPILNSPMDIFSQFLILDGGETFGENFYAFRATYFWDKNVSMPKHRYFPNWEIKPGAVSQISSKIFSRAFRIKKEECLDLPPLVREVVQVEMSKEQAKHYDEMEKDFITYIDDQACVAQLALTKGLRLSQIVSGYVKVHDGKAKSLKQTPRQIALEELLEDLTPQHKVIVWAVFRENYKQVRTVCEKIGVKYVECHGEVSAKAKLEAVDKFNNEDDIRVYLGHPRSGGIGVNLVSASYSIIYSRNFSLEDDLQAESRNHRGGSEIHKKITRIDIVTPGTIDELILDALSKKEAISEKTLKRLKEKHTWKQSQTTTGETLIQSRLMI